MKIGEIALGVGALVVVVVVYKKFVEKKPSTPVDDITGLFGGIGGIVSKVKEVVSPKPTTTAAGPVGSPKSPPKEAGTMAGRGVPLPGAGLDLDRSSYSGRVPVFTGFVLPEIS